MNAMILPFERPIKPDCVPPPFISHMHCALQFIGTREQLVDWRVATENMFPVSPKRIAYGDEWTVRSLKTGFYKVHRDKPPESMWKMAKEIIRDGSFEAKVSRAILHLHELKMSFFDEDGGDYRIRAAETDAFEKVEAAFARAVIDAAVLKSGARSA